MFRTICIFTCAFAFCTSLSAQNLEWTDAREQSAQKMLINPSTYRTVSVNFDDLKQVLMAAPSEGTSIDDSNFSITLPTPEGGREAFTIVESSVMAPALQASYPDIRTFMGVGHGAYEGASIRLDFTLKGFHAQILMPENSFYIDPVSTEDLNVYMVYTREAFFESNSKTVGECLSDDLSISGAPSPGSNTQPVNGGQELEEMDFSSSRASNGTILRTYQLALACTGEYASFHGGTVPLAMSAMTTTMNRVNGIYIRDLSLRMIMVPDNDDLIYLNGAFDPYTNGNTGAMIGQNQTVVNAVIGAAFYDIGHVFGSGSNAGLASLAVVCNNSSKARGVTGSVSPVGDPFDVDYVAHELGHQFGAQHTQNNNCQRSATSAYEPGSASTIMGYAGICAPNLQSNSDAHFHNHSYNQMRTFTAVGSGDFCATATSSGNNPPSVTVPFSGFSIPRNTPFELTATASDVNSDPLTYCWEEYDLGPATASGDASLTNPSGTQPIFRSWPPTSSSTRVFPRLSNLVNNTTVIGELLPSYARALTFRCTVRDGDPDGGGVNDAQVSFNVAGNSGPFLVTAPNTSSVSWASGTSQTVTWSVANTTAAPVSCSNVDIFLSTDGGFTYPTLLLSNTPNDGSASITVPNIATTQARIKVKARFNVFFDISNQNFTIAQVSATNDAICSATTIICGETLTGSNLGATSSSLGSPSCATGTDNDVFYQFAATANSTYTITCNGSDYDAVLAVYSGSCSGALTELGCVDDGLSAGDQETLIFTADEDAQIYIQTYDWGSNGGNFTISLACDFGNDDPCGAIALSCGETILGSTNGATGSSAGSPSCSGGSEEDLWYSFTAGLGFVQTITVNGSNFDGVLAAYTGNCNGTLTQIGCSDSGIGNGLEESLELSPVAGTIVYIQVYDWFTNAGEFTLSLECGFSNDFICNAIPIDCGENIDGSTIGATDDPDIGAPECSFLPSSENDVFFKIDATPNQEYTIDLSGMNIDGVLAAYSGGACSSMLTEIACSDVFLDGNDESISFEVEAAETIWIQVYDYNINGGEFNIAVSCEPIFDCPSLSANIGDPCSDGDPDTSDDMITSDCDCEGIIVPANDLCTDAQMIWVNIPGDCPINEVTGTTVAATDTEGYECESSSPDVFYAINSGSYSSIELTLSAISASDLVLNIYESCASTEGEILNCSIGVDQELELEVEPNTDYIIRVHSLSSASAGSFNICVQGLYDCPALSANVGDACNDGDPATINDVVTAACACQGTAAGTGTLSGTANWISACGSRDMTVKLYTPGTSLLFQTYNTTITASGSFSVPSIPAGTYDVFVKVDGYLQKGFASVTITNSGISIDVGNMINGDINNSNGINISDLTILSAVFGQIEGSAGYNPDADLNCSGGVNISDLTILSSSFGVSGAAPPILFSPLD